MKSGDFAKMFGLNKGDVDAFLMRPEFGNVVKKGLGGINIDDRVNMQGLASRFNDYNAANRAQQAAMAAEQAEREERARVAAEEKRRALATMLITSGFNFDGYKIAKYSGYISGDDCVTMPRDDFWGSNKVADNLCGALVQIRRKAIQELKEAAYDLGCNAVIGVDFDYLTMDPQHAAALNAQITVYEPYVICVTANGNAVVIEKD